MASLPTLELDISRIIDEIVTCVKSKLLPDWKLDELCRQQP